jgi:hypothetical protein
MPLLSRLTTGPLYPLYRTTGVYGHWPRNGMVGYLTLITKKREYKFWYGLRNPYRPGKIVEWHPRSVPEAYMIQQPNGSMLYLPRGQRIARHD